MTSNTQVFDRASGHPVLVADYAEKNTQWRAITTEYALWLRGDEPWITLRDGWTYREPMDWDSEQDESVYLCVRFFNGQYYAQHCTISDYYMLPDPSFEGSEVNQ